MNEQESGELKADVRYLVREVGEIKEALKTGYVSRDEFAPIRNVVYGMISTILLAVLGAIVALVLRQ